MLDGVELTSLITDSRFDTDGWTGEINTEMKGLGRLRLSGKGLGQAQGDAPLTVQRLVVRLEDGGMLPRIASAQWRHRAEPSAMGTDDRQHGQGCARASWHR